MSADLADIKALIRLCHDDFEVFAKTCLKIRTKSGALRAFILNDEQKQLHAKLQAQLTKTGRVRAIILKGRQQGISTYVQGRFYWLLWRSQSSNALRAFILTHEQQATDNLFGMAQTFHDYMPAHIRPVTRAANAKELVFSDTGCAYHVGTAGGKEVGRSSTIQMLHGSESAFWPNAESHIVSLLSTALSKAPGTEAILESTANGIGNVFHRYWQSAVRGESEFEAIFIPWFWHKDYRLPCPAAHKWSDEWLEYGYLHKLEWEQLYWAYITNRTMAQAMSMGDEKPCPKFDQEFPPTADAAFVSSGQSFIPAISVLRARRVETPIIGRGPIILGIDPARSVDKVGIIDRCGRRMGERICVAMEPGGNIPHLAAQLAKIIGQIRPDAVNIDVGNNGAAVYDILIDMGYGYCLNAVNFGSSPIGLGPTGDTLYVNRRAEMYDEMRNWFETDGGVQIPDQDDLHADLIAMEWGSGATRYNTSNELIMEEKDKIKQRLGHSPDKADAAALTFAVPHSHLMIARNQPPPPRKVTRKTGY